MPTPIALALGPQANFKKYRKFNRSLPSSSGTQADLERATRKTDAVLPGRSLSATIADDDEGGWEVLVLGYFWKNGRPKFKYIIIEKEVECKKDMPIFVNRSKAMM